jgi:hypothetical protein
MYSTLITELKELKDLKRKKRGTKLETKDQLAKCRLEL